MPRTTNRSWLRQEEQDYFKQKYSWLTDDVLQGLFDSQAFEYHPSSIFSEDYWSATSDLNRWLSWADQYYKSIEPYKGTQYYNLLQNNPYFSYQSGLSDTDWNSRVNEAAAYQSKILGTAFENQFNSPVSAVNRDRQAGFNDALTGQLAGTQQASDTAPQEARPTTGPSDDAVLAAELQDKQNRFDRGMRLASIPVTFIQTCTGALGAFVGLVRLGMDASKLAADNALTAEQTELAKQQTAGQKAVNQNTWRAQFLDTLLGGLDLSSGTVNIGDRIKNISRDAWTPEQSSYFDSLNDSGYFATSDGTASAAALQEYASRLSGTSSDMFSAGQNLGRTGGLSLLADPSAAVAEVIEIYTDYEMQSMQNDLNRQVLANQLSQEQVGLVRAQEAYTRAQQSYTEQMEDLAVEQTQKESALADIASLERDMKARQDRVDQLMKQYEEANARAFAIKAEGQQKILDKIQNAPAIVKQSTIGMLRALDGNDESLLESAKQGPRDVLSGITSLGGLFKK